MAIIREIIFRFLDQKKDKVFVFGSRAEGKSRRFSDIDIGIDSKKEIPWAKLGAIEEAFEESDLPYTVDIVDFKTVSRRFKEVVGKNLIYLN